MNCEKCGKELIPNDKFCRNCGNPIVGDNIGNNIANNIDYNIEDNSKKDNGSAKRKWMIFVCVAVLMIIGFLAGIAIGYIKSNSKERQIAKQLDLGQKYLEDMDYEQAIVAFNKVIEIDPRSVEAYLGMVEVYIRTTDFETALEYAKKGYKATGDDRLKEKIDMIESGNIFAENGWTMKRSYYAADELASYCVYSYNLNGTTDTATAYLGDGTMTTKIECKYDDDGNQIEGYTESWGNDAIVHLNKTVREYDSDGNLVSMERYKSDGSPSSYEEYEYDENGCTSKIVTYRRTSDGNDWEFYDTTEYEYDSDGNLAYRRNYDSEGNLSMCYEHIDNRVNRYDGNGTLLGYWVYEYDSDGNLKSEKSYDADGNLETEIKYE